MNIVAIDTATEAFSVALKSGETVYSRYDVQPRMHAQLLLPALDELFAQAGIERDSLDAIAFGRGPGAFTGVRIAAAASQAISMAQDIPVAPVSTLAAIARRAWRENNAANVAVAIDARMGEVYWGTYQADASIPIRTDDERVCLPSAVGALRGVWSVAGTGWQTYPQELSRASGIEAVDPKVTLPHAIDILEIGEQIIQRGDGVDAAQALPVYLRDNVAKTEAERSP